MATQLLKPQTTPTYASLTGAPLSLLKPTNNTEYQSRLTSLLNPPQIGYKAPATPLVYSPSYLMAHSTPAVAPKTPTPAPTAVKTPTATPTPTPVVTPSTGAYSVKSGDTLSAIAQRNGTTVQALLASNPNISDPNRIQIGQSIKLPSGGTPTATPVKNNPVVNTPAVNTPAGSPIPMNSNIAVDSSKAYAEYAGKAGLSYNDYVALHLPTKEESDKLAGELGITTLEGELFKKPSQTSEEMYTKAYDTAGLSKVKAQIDALNKEINTDREEARLAIGAVDENPFLTETSRVGRGKRVLDQLEQKIGNKLKQVDQYNTLYTQGINEINGMITRNQNDFGLNQKIDEAKLNYLLKKQEVQKGQMASEQAKKNIGGYASGKNDSVKPETIGSADAGYYRWDATLGKFVQVVAPVNGANGTFKPTNEQQALVGRFISTPEGKALGATPEDLQKALTDQGFFYFLLQKANENGVY